MGKNRFHVLNSVDVYKTELSWELSNPAAHSKDALDSWTIVKELLVAIDTLIFHYNEYVSGVLPKLGYYDVPNIYGINACLRDEARPICIEHITHFFDLGPKTVSQHKSDLVRELGLKGNELLKFLGPDFYWTCVYCQKAGTPEMGPDGRVWHIDHGYPKALGGDDDIENLILACATCNISKNKKTVMAVLKRVFENTEGCK